MRRLFMMLMFMVGVTMLATPQTKNTNGTFVIKFIQMTNWAHLIDPQTKEIKVSVIGDLGAYSFLSEYCKNKQIAGKAIVIDNPSDITAVHKSNVVYIGQNNKNSKYILQTCLGKPVLTICNMRHTTNDGATISFYPNNDGKVVIEVSEGNCKKNNVVLSSKLLNLATMVP